ncbi:hypothetical protein LKI01_20380 [Companilactobacillus paralimentarius]|nr:hypothetical protein LKI01_20380 [Companilactobacillus paralimentarius]
MGRLGAKNFTLYVEFWIFKIDLLVNGTAVNKDFTADRIFNFCSRLVNYSIYYRSSKLLK